MLINDNNETQNKTEEGKMKNLTKKQETIKEDIAQAMESYKEVNGDDNYLHFPAFLTGWLTCKSNEIRITTRKPA